MRPPLSIAVAQPPCVPGDVAANVAAHAGIIRASGAGLVVFPELSLTGYVLAAPAVACNDPVLAPLLEACAATGSAALAGAPIRDEGGLRIATLAITGNGAVPVYSKMFLGGDEQAVFVPGASPAVLEVAGWRVGLGICKDTRIPEQIDGTLALGIDLYAAGLVHHPHELAEQDARAARIIQRGGVAVAFASAAGLAGSEYTSAIGHSTIWAAGGTVLARTGREPGSIAVAVLPA